MELKINYSECSGLKEAKEIWQLNSVPDHVVEGEML